MKGNSIQVAEAELEFKGPCPNTVKLDGHLTLPFLLLNKAQPLSYTILLICQKESFE